MCHMRGEITSNKIRKLGRGFFFLGGYCNQKMCYAIAIDKSCKHDFYTKGRGVENFFLHQNSFAKSFSAAF